MIDIKDLHWLAGILEGEGCFRSNNGNNPTIQIGMTDRDVIERVAVLMGGRVTCYPRPQAHWKPLYTLRIASRKAAGWMMTLYPLMGQRRQTKIREVVTGWAARPRWGQWKRRKGYRYGESRSAEVRQTYTMPSHDTIQVNENKI